jgi:hypothetical protein
VSYEGGEPTLADLEALRRCTQPKNLQDFEHCFGHAVSGCGCAACQEAEVRAGQSDAVERRPTPSGGLSAATPPAYSAEDRAYAEYLVFTGRDPADDPTLAKGEPVDASEEVLAETIRRGIDAVEGLRTLGVDVSDYDDFLADARRRGLTGAADEATWREYLRMTGRPESWGI